MPTLTRLIERAQLAEVGGQHRVLVADVQQVVQAATSEVFAARRRGCRVARRCPLAVGGATGREQLRQVTADALTPHPLQILVHRELRVGERAECDGGINRPVPATPHEVADRGYIRVDRLVLGGVAAERGQVDAQDRELVAQRGVYDRVIVLGAQPKRVAR